MRTLTGNSTTTVKCRSTYLPPVRFAAARGKSDFGSVLFSESRIAGRSSPVFLYEVFFQLATLNTAPVKLFET